MKTEVFIFIYKLPMIHPFHCQIVLKILMLPNPAKWMGIPFT